MSKFFLWGSQFPIHDVWTVCATIFILDSAYFYRITHTKSFLTTTSDLPQLIKSIFSLIIYFVNFDLLFIIISAFKLFVVLSFQVLRSNFNDVLTNISCSRFFMNKNNVFPTRVQVTKENCIICYWQNFSKVMLPDNDLFLGAFIAKNDSLIFLVWGPIPGL